MDVRNCKECGRLFNYVGRNVCPACARKEEEKFTVVKEYIRENPGASMQQVSEETETSVAQIQRWVREERLILTTECVDSGIICESCGKPILTGRYCEHCKKQMANEINQAFKGSAPIKVDNKQNGSTKEKMRYLDRGHM